MKSWAADSPNYNGRGGKQNAIGLPVQDAVAVASRENKLPLGLFVVDPRAEIGKLARVDDPVAWIEPFGARKVPSEIVMARPLDAEETKITDQSGSCANVKPTPVRWLAAATNTDEEKWPK